MITIRTFVLLAACCSLFFTGCSNKNSDEACQHEATMNLDKGNFDAVIALDCANAMQRGAAYFGKAGFSIATVLNTFVDANNAPATTSPLTLFMNNLIPDATNTTLTNIDNALTEYAGVTAAEGNYKDSQFIFGIISSIKGLTLLKLMINVEGAGVLNRQCDRNDNNRADEVDATSCALLISSGTTATCGPGYIITRVPNVTVQGSSAAFEGVITQVTGTGSNVGCPADNMYRRLFYATAGSTQLVATTGQSCAETSPDISRSWPCPLESGGVPSGLAQSFDDSLNGSIYAMDVALTTTQASDVASSIRDIKQQNCCSSPEVWDPNNPSSCACSPPDLATYLQTL